MKWSSLPKSPSCKKNPVSFKLSYILSDLTVNIQVGEIDKSTKCLLCKHEKVLEAFGSWRHVTF